jgi:hypothetical protein
MTHSQSMVTNSTYKLEIYPHVTVMDMAFNNAKFSSLIPYAGMMLKKYYYIQQKHRTKCIHSFHMNYG